MSQFVKLRPRRRHTPRICESCNKRLYTKRRAMRAIKDAAERGVGRYGYQCPVDSQYWHLTSRQILTLGRETSEIVSRGI